MSPLQAAPRQAGAPNANFRRSSSSLIIRYLPVVACAYFAVATFLIALARIPFVDEGTFAGSALNIVRTGFTGNPSTPPWGLGIPLVESQKYNFWVMPGYLYTLAGWYRLFPQTIMSARVLSVIFGVGCIILFYFYVRLLSRSMELATLACCLLALDFTMAYRSAVARMDSMSVFVNLAAWVLYLVLRERRFYLAIFISTLTGMLSLLIHPNGLFALAGVAVLAVLLDRHRLQLRCLVPAAAGVVIPLSLYALVISQAPEVWHSQVQAHSVGRFLGFVHPFHSIKTEFLRRYYDAFGGIEQGMRFYHGSRARLILLAVLATYFASVLFALLKSSIRRSLIGKASLAIFGITVIYFTFFETGKPDVYNIHVMPWFCLFFALAASDLFRHKHWRNLAVAIVFFVALINLAGTIYYARVNQRYALDYRPVLKLFREEMGPRDVVLTHAYFGLDLGFDRVTEDFTMVDIVRRHPKFVTLDQWFTIGGVTKTWPYGPDPASVGMISPQEKKEAMQLLRSKYRIVLENRDYIVYERVRPF
ncbi:MAG TPA: glycosyltransferase family 39 protein [Bryobacteraceae bacterium]|nr:glycosyltransferase family 39 protein [Bryobacteraceae bacterium]